MIARLVRSAIVILLALALTTVASATPQATWYMVMALNEVSIGNGSVLCGTKPGAIDAFNSLGAEDTEQPTNPGAEA